MTGHYSTPNLDRSSFHSSMWISGRFDSILTQVFVNVKLLQRLTFTAIIVGLFVYLVTHVIKK